MLKTTDIHLARLIALREEAFPLAFEAEKRGHLEFNITVSECGTYRCLLGWFLKTETAKADGWKESGCWNGKSWYIDGARDYFGIRPTEVSGLFGLKVFGDLHARAALCDKLIAERMGQ